MGVGNVLGPPWNNVGSKYLFGGSREEREGSHGGRGTPLIRNKRNKLVLRTINDRGQ